MARRPEGDERLVLPECSVAEHGRRIYVTELARYLRHPLPQILRFLRRNRLLHKVGLGTSCDGAKYVTEATAIRVIAWARAIQGEVYLQGKDYHRLLARDAQYTAARRARKKARLLAEKALASASEEREHGE